MTSSHPALDGITAALVRARALTADLDRVDNPTDRHQVQAGVRHELDTALQGLSRLGTALSEAVGGDRPGKVRRDAPATSRAAARTITVETGTARRAILTAIAGNPYGMTDLELQLTLKMNPSTQRPRRGELVDGGYVRPRCGPDGRQVYRRIGATDHTVWEATDAGHLALGQKPPERDPATLF